MTEHKRYGKRARGLYRILIVLCLLVLILAVIAFYFLSEKEAGAEATGKGLDGATELVQDPDAIENGIHLRTGLVVAEGYQEVINNCTNCHSASLVIQNRMDAKGWEATIKWMQETQNLWDLGDKQDRIIGYLVANYPVERKGRREPLKDIEWYPLGEEPQ